MRAVSLLPLVAVLAACDVPTPLAPADPIGEIPKWGEGFAVPAQMPGDSKLAPPTPSAGDDTAAPGKMGDTGDWSGGDVALGKGVFIAMCARCHGAAGEGATLPGNIKVPPLADPAWQASVEDRQIARSVMLGKGAMPSFMNEGLDRPKLSGLVAYVRSLKK